MAATYTPIATYTASGSPAGYTFSSIPSTYTDLVLISSVKTNTANSNLWVRFNSDSGSNYSYTFMSGSGSAASSGRYSNQTEIGLDNYGYPTTTNFNVNILQVNNYGNSSTYKTTLSRGNNADNGTSAVVGLWRNTAAITSIYVATANTLATGSIFTLYGIKAA